VDGSRERVNGMGCSRRDDEEELYTGEYTRLKYGSSIVVVVVGCGGRGGLSETVRRGQSAVVDARVTLTKDKSCDKRVTGEGDKLPPPPTADVSSAAVAGRSLR